MDAVRILSEGCLGVWFTELVKVDSGMKRVKGGSNEESQTESVKNGVEKSIYMRDEVGGRHII